MNRTKSQLTTISLSVFSATAILSHVGSAQAAIVFTYAAPGNQQSDADPKTTVVETFDTLPLGTFKNIKSKNIGTYTSNSSMAQIIKADQYGGAKNSQYITVNGGDQSYTLTLDKSQAYFGAWWSAGDSGNVLDFYSGDSLLASFTTADVINALKEDPNRNAYYGNPNDGVNRRNSSEPYAFLNFYGTDGTTFDKIVFSQTNGGGFESDNHTFSVTEQAVKGTVVASAATPEPLTILGVGAAVGFGICFKRRLNRAI